MKFTIRFADQLVGFFIIAALLSITAIIFLMGSRQRWFAKDISFKTYAASAAGLNNNMPVVYKGFTIGNVKTFDLVEGDRVEVVFSIQEKYRDRVMLGSLVEIQVSPIGLGSQFIFHSGRGDRQLTANEVVPMASSPEGRELIEMGLGSMPAHDDSITVLIARVNTLLDEIGRALAGDDSTTLGRTLLNVEETTADLPEVVDESIKPMLADLRILVAAFTEELSNPNGVLRLVNEDSQVLSGLEASVNSLAANLSNLEKSTAALPRELPQILSNLQTTLSTAQDVLIALRNNPLLKNGVPDHAETGSSGTNPRNIEF
ncbi:MAG: MlaD family protein [Treponema sp.]|jgi:phospholipid/cholesterol/gamma-HCH transport system substrate-binding protein|nr:MlaD family protein [Treponema sp.]